MVNKAVALNPEHPSWYHWGFFNYHFLRGEYEAALADNRRVGWSDYFWTHAHNAAIYGLLGRDSEARQSAQRLLELYPDYAGNFWEEIGKWNFTEGHMQRHADGLRKAGLDIPDKPPAAVQ